MAEVKGIILSNVARLIRASKNVDWKKYLNDKDLEIINSRILPSSWYPLDTYERSEVAIYKEVGKSKPESARMWGRFLMDTMVNTVYHNIALEKDPAVALEKFEMYTKMHYRFDTPDFQALKAVRKSQNQTQVTVKSDRPTKEFEAHCQQSLGTLSRLVEIAGGKEVKAAVIEHDWQGKTPYAVIEFSWK
jgi:hypothetical protein